MFTRMYMLLKHIICNRASMKYTRSKFSELKNSNILKHGRAGEARCERVCIRHRYQYLLTRLRLLKHTIARCLRVYSVIQFQKLNLSALWLYFPYPKPMNFLKNDGIALPLWQFRWPKDPARSAKNVAVLVFDTGSLGH